MLEFFSYVGGQTFRCKKMAIVSVLNEPDPILRKKSLPIATFDSSLKEIACDLTDTLNALCGLGLSAPQIGVLKRLIVYDLQNIQQAMDPKDPTIDALIKEHGRFFIMVNPEITYISSECDKQEEGCFSIPSFHVDVQRPSHIEVTFQTLDERFQTIKASGLWGRCIQHECDHLNGILMLDYLTPFKKTAVLNELEYLKKASKTH